ncbi:MAG: glycosyltransferase family 9 protein [Acetobacteraceae bacterium]|nr:glycosyltransferase family 9 protein [Acetobacteraceae bacterium]
MKLAALRAPDSLVVVRLGAMGDIVHTLYALTALRSALPATRIGWVVEARWAELLAAKGAARQGPRNPTRPLVDSLHLVNTKAWRRAPFQRHTRQEVSSAWQEIRAQHYQLAADFQGATKSALVAKAAAANQIVGMSNPRESLARLFYHQRIPNDRPHVVEQYQALAAAIADRPLVLTGAQLPRDEESEAEAARRTGEWGREFVVLSPGAGWGAKRWPAERYAEVARAVWRDGFLSLINLGPEEHELATVIERAAPQGVRRFTGSLGELIALTRRARLFVGGDSGPLHLAAALEIPLVALFGPTDPRRNGPYSAKGVVLRNPASKTSLSHTARPDPGLLGISTEEVICAVRRTLGKPHA